MLSKKEILKFLKKYKEEKKDIYRIKKLGLFGSYAKEQQSEVSDVDIVVEFNYTLDKITPSFHNLHLHQHPKIHYSYDDNNSFYAL